MQTVQTKPSKLPPAFEPSIVSYMEQNCERPQMFTSFITRKTYDVRAAWRLISAAPREIEVLDLGHEAEGISQADIDQEWAGQLTRGQLHVPLLCFQLPVRVKETGESRMLMHILDGWHRAWRRLSEGNVLTAAFELTDGEMAKITFKGPDEIFAYQAQAVQTNPQILSHDCRRAAQATGIPQAVVERAVQVLFQLGPNGMIAVVLAAGYDPQKLEDWIKTQKGAEMGGLE